MRITTSLAAQETQKLWQQFKPMLKNIPGHVPRYFFSVAVYQDASYFNSFNIHSHFEKWAAVEVVNQVEMPPGVELMTLPGGLYAEFIHKGTPDKFAQTAAYIYSQWLPGSGYVLDNRPHFEIMDASYHPQDEQAEEKIYIPITLRNQLS